MRAALSIACAIAALALGVAVSGVVRADDAEFQVIVNPANPATSISRGFVRDVFLKKATSWRHGTAARPVDLPAGRVRERFTQTIVKKTRAQLRSYWNQQIFSGKGVPPPEAESVAEVIAFVRTHPGAVAYVPAGIAVEGAKVIRLGD